MPAACCTRARPESFGAHGAVPPYLREASLAAALASLKASPADHHVVVLKDDGVRTFRGVYAVGRGGACEKIHGRGPARFAEADVATFLKFNSARRAFVKLPSRSFSLTTDAVMLSASVLPKNKPVLY